MGHPGLIAGFAIIVIAILFFDLFIFGKKSHKVTSKEALNWSIFYVAIACIFGGVIYYVDSPQHATEYFTAYIIEKALSVDNLFVFIMVFGFFKVPEEYHHKVLFWGVLGALVMRAIFIFAGVGLITWSNFQLWGMTVNPLIIGFGVFLLYAGVKSFKNDDDEEEDYSKSAGAKLINKLFKGRVTEDYDGDKFFTCKYEGSGDGGGVSLVKYATPLLVVVAVIEFTDLLFAVDSIPAIFSVSKDPFVLYASNIFAILGLRTLYFLLANFMHLFRFLKYGLGIILAFIGLKMLISPVYHVDSTLSLCIVAIVLILSTVLSTVIPEKEV